MQAKPKRSLKLAGLLLLALTLFHSPLCSQDYWEATGATPDAPGFVVHLMASSKGELFVLTARHKQFFGDPEPPVYKLFGSVDGGDFWEEIELPADPNPLSMAIDDQDRLWIGAARNRLMRSTNAGATWSELPAVGMPSQRFVLGFHFASNGRIFVEQETRIDENTVNSSIYYSDDDGGLFETMPDFVNGFTRALALHVHWDGIVYVSYGFGGLWRSTADLRDYQHIKDYRSGLPHYVTTIGGNPGSDLLIAGGSEGVGDFDADLARSTDNGLTWIHMFSLPSERDDNFTEEILFTDNGDILVSTSHEGIIRSSDDGVSWQRLNDGLGDVRSIGPMTQDRTGRIYAGSKTSVRIFRSSGEPVPVSDAADKKVQMKLFPNPATIAGPLQIDYRIAEPGQVSLVLINMLGQPELNLVHDEFRNSGQSYSLDLTARMKERSALAAGRYYVILRLNGRQVAVDSVLILP